MDIPERHLHGLEQALAGPTRNRQLGEAHTMCPGTKGLANQIRCLDRLLWVDTEEGFIWVEAGMTMDQLSSELALRNVMPLVVPEFKGITVGGAVSGGAGESSSHRYGLLSDTCEAYHWIGSNDDKQIISPENREDLFYGISGSYGSLGCISAVRMKVRPLVPYVHVRYDVASRVSYFGDFIDAVVFSPSRMVAMEGELCHRPPPGVRQASYSGLRDPWFIDRVASVDGFYEETFSLHDYFFRWDRGAFWMGAYLHRPRDLLEIACRRIPPNLLLHLPSRWWMRLMGSKWYGSTPLYRRLHRLPMDQIHKHLVVQDLMLPRERLDEFLERFHREIGIYPLWLCPVKGTQTPQFFAPHYGGDSFINVGVYGAAPDENGRELTRRLEALCLEFGGRKTLYASSCYTEDELWKIYDKEAYLRLRHAYELEEYPPFSQVLSH